MNFNYTPTRSYDFDQMIRDAKAREERQKILKERKERIMEQSFNNKERVVGIVKANEARKWL